MTEENVQDKFIFTTEGRNSLVSQLGGIRFAILGAVLVQGLEPVDPKLFFDTYKGETLESLTSKSGVILGLKNVNYVSSDNGVSPENNYVYLEAIHNITNNLIPLHYIPSTELADNKTSVFGNYELEFDKTLINWDNAYDVKRFNHIGFIGKQYAQTDDATYNVEKTQKPVLVGIAQIAGIQLLANQNEYANTKLRIRLTLDEQDKDITEVVKTEAAQELLDVANKMSLVNNGVKTTNVPFSITDNKKIVDDFKLNENGAVAMTKTLMVAETFEAAEAENDFNGVGLMHLINAKDSPREFTPQVVLSTLEEIKQDEPINGYNVEFLLRGTSGDTNTKVTGNAIDEGYDLPYEEINYNNSTYGTGTTGTENKFYNYDYSGFISPLFKIDSIPADDEIGVDIFGIGNKILETNDKLLFSKNNILWNSENSLPQDDTDKKENVLIASNRNFLDIKYGANILFGSIENAIKENSSDNGFFNSHYNILGHDASHINLFGSIDNRINVNYSYRDENSNDITILNSCNNSIDASNNTTLINSDGNTITYSENVTLLNVHDSRVVNNIISQSLDTETHGHGVIINGKYNEIDFFEDVTIIGNGLRASDYRPYHTNYPLLILGKYNNFGRGYFVTGYTDNTQTTTTVYQPGIIYGNGTDDASRNNALEFYPELGLLRVKNKNGKWTELGGDNGLKLPDNATLDSISFKNKNINNGTVSIDTTNVPKIELTNPVGAKTIIKPTVITVKGTNDEINRRVEITRSDIKLYNNAGENNVTINNNGINFYDDNNRLITKVTKDNYYQKARADIIIKTKQNLANDGFECSVLNYHGPNTVKEWLTNIWEKAPPFAYCNAEKSSNLTNGIFVKKTSTGWVKTERTPFATFVNSDDNINGSVGIINEDNSVDYFSMLDKNIDLSEPMLQELEINLYVEDFDGYDMHLLWVLSRHPATATPLVNTEIKINVFVCHGRYANNAGEDLHFWTPKTIIADNQTVFSKEYKMVSIDGYDRFTTLIANPGNLTNGHIVGPGWWRMN